MCSVRLIINEPFKNKKESTLPQDMSIFQRNRHAVAMRHEPHRIVRRRASRRHPCAIGVAVCCAHQLPHAFHLHSLRCCAVKTIGIKLDPHCLRVEVIEIHLNLEYMLLAIGFNLHFAEA